MRAERSIFFFVYLKMIVLLQFLALRGWVLWKYFALAQNLWKWLNFRAPTEEIEKSGLRILDNNMAKYWAKKRATYGKNVRI